MHHQPLQEYDINLRMWVGVKKLFHSHLPTHTIIFFFFFHTDPTLAYKSSVLFFVFCFFVSPGFPL